MGSIETHQAKLDTLAIEIQALRVSGKQMTLSVFRQLPEGVDGGEQIIGARPWGIVRYKIDDVVLHLVYSNKHQLFRRELNVDTPSRSRVNKIESDITKIEQDKFGYDSEYILRGYGVTDELLCKKDLNMRFKPPVERNRILREVGLSHLKTILEDRKSLYEEQCLMFDRDKDYMEKLPQLFIAV